MGSTPGFPVSLNISASQTTHNPPLKLRHLYFTLFLLDTLVPYAQILPWLRRIARGWIAIPATLLIGVSAGLPLFLYLRQRQLDASARVTTE